MERLAQVSNHLAPIAIGSKNSNDVVIVCAVRTAITRAKRGGFKDTHPDQLLTAVLKAIHERTKLNVNLVEDVVVGNVLPAGGGATAARMATLCAGYPDRTSVMTVNRQCSSGLQACAIVAQQIATGTINIGIGAGVESMTRDYGAGAMSPVSERAEEKAGDCLLPMGITSENVASRYGVTRAEQDAFATESHLKAAAAQKRGQFKDEIVPVHTEVLDKEGNAQSVVIDKDDGIRATTTPEGLAKLKPAFGENGTTTAGNASQVSDGAAAVLMMRRSMAEKLRLPILAKFVCSAVVGVAPNEMGIGPAEAIPAACKKAGIPIHKLDVIELNEAFASQAVYCVKKLGLKNVNPNGGAIALGHPLGCTGARQIATILRELKSGQVGAVSMCIGTGMGMCSIIEKE